MYFGLSNRLNKSLYKTLMVFHLRITITPCIYSYKFTKKRISLYVNSKCCNMTETLPRPVDNTFLFESFYHLFDSTSIKLDLEILCLQSKTVRFFSKLYLQPKIKI